MKKIIIPAIIFLLSKTLSAQEVSKIKITELEKIITESKEPLIINLWATWCGPCVEELPYFLEEWKDKKEKGLRLILVSLDFEDDYPEKIEKFMSRRKIKPPVMWLNETDADYFCPKIDPRWSGAIPASLFINNTTGYRSFFEGQMSSKEIKKETKSIMSN